MALIGKKFSGNKNKNLIDSFKHAYEGIVYAVIKEKNMHIHVSVAILVIVCGMIFQLSYAEWLACLILIALVISLEMINTAVEAVVDLITTKEDPLAKVAKDTAAGAVLVSAIVAAFIGLVIFVPKIFDYLISIGM